MTETVRAVIKAAPEPGLALARYSILSLSPKEIPVKVKAASTCRTDLHISRWDPWAQGCIHPPLIVRHEFRGEIVKLGPAVNDICVGDFTSHVVWGRCNIRRAHKGHLCHNARILGVDHNSAFADLIVIPAQNAWSPADSPSKLFVLLKNCGNAIHIPFAVDLRAHKMLIAGCGPVRPTTIAVAYVLGAQMVIVTDISPHRLELARLMGADRILDTIDGSDSRPHRGQGRHAAGDVRRSLCHPREIGLPLTLDEAHGEGILSRGSQGIVCQFGLQGRSHHVAKVNRLSENARCFEEEMRCLGFNRGKRITPIIPVMIGHTPRSGFQPLPLRGGNVRPSPWLSHHRPVEQGPHPDDVLRRPRTTRPEFRPGGLRKGRLGVGRDLKPHRARETRKPLTLPTERRPGRACPSGPTMACESSLREGTL